MRFNFGFALLLACFFLSGFAGLIYQTAWLLELSLVFGTTELALVSVLSAYMAGLALGAAIAGRLVHKLRRPVLVYGLLELGIGLSALVVSIAIHLAGGLQSALMGGHDLPSTAESTGAGLFYLASSFTILLVPTALMGATLPLLARWAVRKTSEIGPKISILYTANTAGAAAGTVTAAFWLLPWLGLGGTVATAVSINFLVFILVIPGARDHSAQESNLVIESFRVPLNHSGRWVLPVMLLSGAVAFTWEVLWTRLLGHLLGGSVYAFATMLATYLIGIALGSGIASTLARTMDQARITFSIAQLSIAGLSLATLTATERLASFAKPISQEGYLLTGVLVTGALLLPGALASGATFPLAVRLLARHAEDAAPSSARVFAWNTVGAIIGALTTGYLLLPLFRFAGTATLAATLSIGLAVVAASTGPRYRRVLLGVAGSALIVLFLFPPSTPWRILRHSPLSGKPVNPSSEVVYFGVGKSSTVMMTELANQWRLTTNGLPESGIVKPWTRPGRFVVARWLSLLPLATRPDTRSLLVVGLGAGVTIDQLPNSLEEIHVIELESEVLRANRAVIDRPTQPLDDPRVQIHINDARSALRLTGRQFDAIVSQPSHPWTSGSANLFTREFFALVRDRLSPDGVFVQWMGLTFIDGPLLQSLVATALSVFPYVQVYRPVPGVVLIMGSASPMDILATAPHSLTTAPEQWAAIGILEAEDLFVAQALNSEGSHAFAGDVQPITDRRNVLRHRSPQVLRSPLLAAGATQLLSPFEPLSDQKIKTNPYLLRRLIRQGELDRARTLVDQLPPKEAYSYLAMCDLASGQLRQAEVLLQRGLKLNPNDTEARAALLQLHQPLIAKSGPVPFVLSPLNQQELAIVDGWRLDAIADWTGLGKLEARLANIDPKHPLFSEACRLRASWRAASGDPILAQQAIDLVTPLIAPNPRPRDLLIRARAASSARDSRTALASLEEALSLRGLPRLQRAFAQRAQIILNSLPNSQSMDPSSRNLQARIDHILNNATPAVRSP